MAAALEPKYEERNYLVNPYVSILTKIMERNPFWKTNSRLATQDIPRLFWKP